MTKSKRRAEAGVAQLRRLYMDGPTGQVHLTTAYPPSGGFDECTPLVFLHADGGTGADFNRVAALLGFDRSVYAPDLPGSGASDADKGRSTVASHAAAIADLIDQLRLKKVDLIGMGRGASIAAELATLRAQVVRRVVVVGAAAVPAVSKPLLQLDLDAAGLTAGPVEPLVAAIRRFLDRV